MSLHRNILKASVSGLFVSNVSGHMSKLGEKFLHLKTGINQTDICDHFSDGFSLPFVGY